MWAAKYVLCALACVAFASASPRSERRRKNILSIPEEQKVPPSLAPTLDMSCSEARILAPEINHGKVIQYDRRRRGKKVFLVAFYTCDESYEFENENTEMFCSNQKWVGEIPTCIPQPDYSEPEDEAEEDELEEYETVPIEEFEESENDIESDDNDREPPPPPPPPVKEADPAPEPDIVININEDKTELPQDRAPQQSENDSFIEIEPEAKEVPNSPSEVPNPSSTSDRPTKDRYEPTLLDTNCGKDNGGCAQICKRLLYPDENQPIKQCDCREGYTLDPKDYVSCIDIDECQESNGGCSEICENMPGEYKCSCQAGYYIDASGKTCVDIDECANPELSSDCQGDCENLPGSYRCVEPLVEKVETLNSTEVVESPVVEDNSTPLITVVEPPPKKVCNPGFQLSADGTECQDIDECELRVPGGRGVCEQNCENTIGSFRCSCSEGYQLSEDEHSCSLPEDPCIGKCLPGSCLASEDSTSFSCICPAGYRSENSGCQDIDECAEDTHLCSHSCQNTPGGYECLCPEGLNLVEEYTCLAENLCEVNNNGCEQICLSGRGGACACREGFQLKPNGKSCEDVDECLVDNGGCQQVCRNSPGSFTCACERGYELGRDKRSCHDVDECAGIFSGGCSHECINKAGTYECACPLGYTLKEDGRTCRPVLVGCPPGTKRSSEGCAPIKCEAGFAVGLDDECEDIDECLKNNGGCSHRCTNSEGSFKCSCPPGYELDTDEMTCVDIDECDPSKNSCSAGKCVNEIGGFRCEFPEYPKLPDIPEWHEEPKTESKTPEFIDLNDLSRNLPETPKRNFPDFPEYPKLDLPKWPEMPKTEFKKPEYPDLNDLSRNLPETPKRNFPDFPEYPKLDLPKWPEVPKTEFKKPEYPDFNDLSKNIPETPKRKRPEFPELPEWPRRELPRLPPLDDLPTPETPVPVLPELPQSPTDNQLQPTDQSNHLPEAPEYPVVPESKFPDLPEWPRAEVPRPIDDLPTPRTPVAKPSELPPRPRVNELQPRDLCPRFQAPRNGRSQCNRYRHKAKNFYFSRCRVSCNRGYVLRGPAIKNCGANGIWEGPETTCVSLNRRGICHALQPARNGLISPASCTQGPSKFGDICQLTCNPGFIPTGSSLASCMMFNGWSFGADLNCVPIDNTLFANEILPPQWNSPFKATLPTTHKVQVDEPFVKCPENVVILLNHGEQKAHVTLQRPKTNVKDGRLVVYPEWAADLQGHLPAGLHTVNFAVVYGPDRRTVKCRTIITVKPASLNSFGVSSVPAGYRRSSLPRPAPFVPLSSGSSSSYPAFQSFDSAPQSFSFPTFSTHSSIREAPLSTSSSSLAEPLSRESSLEARPFSSFASHSSLQQVELPSFSSPDTETFSRPDSFSQRSAQLVSSAPSAFGESTRVDLGSDTTNYCPPSFEVYLKENQNLRSVAWDEPRFEGKLLKLYKSHFPGSLFKLGDHTIDYEATTTDGRTLRCTFTIYVRAPRPTPAPIQPEFNFDSEPANLIAGYGSFVVCPGKEPVRVTADQSVELPVGCTLKNVRPQSSPRKQLKLAKLTSLWHHYNF
ncbi:uncharacterized protein LOC108028666 isoform X2 [Drosophila biarmipes]|uniref:uncharacterized protein LOC108028666 isoform X2 n=1 Tax=Drosophila biarmipes TaxID=125945 RepID=UPI0007E839E2|nr:uncharacterized protein LOC108028666 isoform X2 [Drosophila biarmipes]